MHLPLRIRGVHYYRILRGYVFAGDLFISRRTLYFFPMIDLEQQRNRNGRYLPHQIGFVVIAGTYLLQKVGTSYASPNDVWDEGISDEQFREKADAYIEARKAERRDRGVSELMPVPLRISADEISNLTLSLTGKLSFLAQSDKQDFNIGLRNRNRLRDAFWESGLGKV